MFSELDLFNFLTRVARNVNMKHSLKREARLDCSSAC